MLLDANLVYTAPDKRWSLGVHGRNLTDKQYKTSGYQFLVVDPVTGAPTRRAVATPTAPVGSVVPSLGTEGVVTAFYGNPRQVFLSLGAKF